MSGLGLIWFKLALCAAAIAVAGAALTRHADVIAEKTGWLIGHVGVVLARLTKPSGRVLRLAGWAGIALSGMCALNAYVLFRHGV